MRKIYLILLPLFLGLTLQASAQSKNISQTWEFVPKFGHAQMVESALKEHVAWRVANGDPWSWDVYQVVSGDNLNTFYARSGSHAWADFDSYMLEGANEHFEKTVVPHLESLSNRLSAADTTNVLWSDEKEFKLFNVTSYDVVPARQRGMVEALGKFSSAIKKHNLEAYHFFEWTQSGGDNVTDLIGVFPSVDWDGFNEDPAVWQAMTEEYGEEGFTQIVQAFMAGIRNGYTRVLMHRTDLSSSGAM